MSKKVGAGWGLGQNKRKKDFKSFLYNLLKSFNILWCRDQESNQGHTDFQSVALPTELSRQSIC